MAQFNVKTIGGAGTGEAGWAYDAAMTSGNNHVTSASNPWAAGDVGKTIYVGGSTNAAAPIITRAGGVITAFNSAGDVTIDKTAAFSATNCYCVWGQDDSAAFLAAQSAANAAGVGNTVYVPNGKYICKSRIWAPGGNYANLVGESALGTWILLPTSNLTNPGDGTATLIESNRAFVEIGNLSFYGPKVSETGMSSGQAFIRIGGAFVRVHDLQIYSLASTIASTAAIEFSGASTFSLERLYAQVQSSLGYDSGSTFGVRFNGSYGNVYDLLSSLFTPGNLIVSNNPIGTGSNSGLLNFFGGLIDECVNDTGSVQLLGGNISAVGMTMWGAGGATRRALYVNGTSTARLVNCEVGPFVALSPNCMLIDSGGEVRAANSIFRGAGSNKVCIVNNGKFIDCGGNLFRNGFGGTYADISYRDALSIVSHPNMIFSGASSVSLPVGG